MEGETFLLQAEVKYGRQRPEAMFVDLLFSEGSKAIKLHIWMVASPVLEVLQWGFWEEGRWLVRLMGKTSLTWPWGKARTTALKQRMRFPCYKEGSHTEERAMFTCWSLEAVTEIWKPVCPLHPQWSCPGTFFHVCLCLTLKHIVT